jgi:Phage integrase, N-terminal SAM-like domain
MIAAAKRGQPLPAAEDVRRRLGLGLDPGLPGDTVGEWLTTWLASRRKIRPSVARSYQQHIENWLVPHLGDIQLEKLNAGHIAGLFATIDAFNAEIGRQRADGRALIEIEGDVRSQPRAVGPTTQRRIFATLRAALNAAVKQRKIMYSPCQGVELDPEARTEARRWTAGEAARFLAATDGDQLGLMFRIAVLRDAGVDRDVRMREAGHADAQVADRHTHVLDAAHRAAAEQVAALVKEAGNGS